MFPFLLRKRVERTLACQLNIGNSFEASPRGGGKQEVAQRGGGRRTVQACSKPQLASRSFRDAQQFCYILVIPKPFVTFDELQVGGGRLALPLERLLRFPPLIDDSREKMGEKEKHSSEPKCGTLARSRDPSAAGAGAARARGGRGRRRRLERAKAGPAPHDSPAAAQSVSNLFCPPGFVNTSALRLKSAAFSSPPPGEGPLSQQDFQVHASSASPPPPVRIHIFSFLLMHSVMQALTPTSSQPACGFRSNCIQQSFGAIEPWLLVS